MSKFLNKPIKVDFSIDQPAFSLGQPKSFLWQKEWFSIKEVLEHWKDTGCWWEKEAEKDFYRVITSNQSLCEIFFDSGQQKWYLYKIYD